MCLIIDSLWGGKVHPTEEETTLILIVHPLSHNSQFKDLKICLDNLKMHSLIKVA